MPSYPPPSTSGVAPSLVDIRQFGAKCDGLALTDVTTTNASAVISSTSHAFVSRDVGKYITIAGAGAAGVVLNATILSISAGNATLSAAAGTSIAGIGVATFGTDDSTVINAAILAGRSLLLPAGICVVASTLTWKTNCSLYGLGAGKSILKWISTTDMASAVIQGLAPDFLDASVFKDVQFIDLEIDVEAATQAVYNVAGKAFFFQVMRRPLFENLYVHGSPASGIGIDYLQAGRIVNNVVANCGRLASSVSPGGSGIGIGTGPSTFSDGSIISGNTVYMPTAGSGRYGIFLETQNTQSIASWNRVEGNLIYLYGAQYGIGVSGTYSTLVANNTISGNGTTSQRGISIDLGTLTGGGAIGSADPYGKIIGNIVKFVDLGIYYEGTGTTQVTPATLTIENNTILNSVRYGIWLHSGASIALDGISINGGVIYGSGAAGILLDGAAGFQNIAINNVKAFNNALTTATATLKAAVSIGSTVARLSMRGNDFYDDGVSKQLYGIIVNAVAVTAAHISANNLSGNVTGAINLAGGGTLVGWLSDNPGAISGTTTNDSAAAGYVGEYISSTILVANVVSLVSNTTKTITSISLTAGDWDVWGAVSFSPNGTTTITAFKGGISATDNALATSPGDGGMFTMTASFATGTGCTIPVGKARVSLAATTTYYLVANSVFAISTMGGYGILAARRVR